MSSARAFAPATIANVAVGFDILGFPLESVGDIVTVTSFPHSGLAAQVTLEVLDGTDEIPREPEKNSASVALLAMVNDLNVPMGFAISLEKGIPLSSGMGGSAASAVGAVVAANSLLDQPLPTSRLLGYALAGEAAITGAPHADNVAPCLFGGLTAALPGLPPTAVPIPVPNSLLVVVVRPHLRLDTRTARAALRPTLSLAAHVEQSGHLAGFIAACFLDDLDLLQRSMKDLVIEPQRMRSLPWVPRVRKAAMAAGALACSIAGSGPSLFAWVSAPETAQAVRNAMQDCFRTQGLDNDSWISRIAERGARVLDPS